MAEWQAEVFRYTSSKPEVIGQDDGESVTLELLIEDWLKRKGVPGQSIGRIRWLEDKKIHHVIYLHADGEIEIENTPDAAWPIFFPDEADSGEGGEWDGEGEGGGKVRIFGRFFDGRRWRKPGITDTEKKNYSIVRWQAGEIDEDEAEIMGENHRRARQQQVLVTYAHADQAEFHTLNLRLPRGVELEQRTDGWWQAKVPNGSHLHKC